MIPVYICDDEAAVREGLQKRLAHLIAAGNHDMELAGAFAAPGPLVQAVEQAPRRGVYFLDVDLKRPGEDGFSLAAALRARDPRGFIVFVTTHGELALETFRYRLEALDYIEKDDPANLDARLAACLSAVESRLLAETHEAADLFTFKVFDEVRHVPVAEILYIETAPGKQKKLALHTGGDILEFFGRLGEVEATLGEGFWRCHRSFLVNRARVTRVSGREGLVQLDTGETCPLSRKAKKAL